MIDIDRRKFFTSLGGVAAVAAMSSEAKADALEDFLNDELNETADESAPGAKKFPTVAEIEAQIETRPFRRGLGGLFTGGTGNVKKLQPMPAAPAFVDFFKLRFQGGANHVLQSANRAMKTGMPEEIILACLLHDTVQSLIK